MKISLSRIGETGAVLVLAGVFFYAGVVKSLDPRRFADDIDAYRLSLGSLTSVAAVAIPGVEIAAALALFHPRSRKGGAAVVAALCAVFLVALGQAAARGFVVDCGCFGREAPTEAGMYRAMLRDVALFVVAAWLLLKRSAGEEGIRPMVTTLGIQREA